MRKIKTEIEQYMTGPIKENKKLLSRCSFPDEFIGFQGHFPEKKILPGVCQIQCALSLLEHASGKTMTLKEIVLAKYFSPVFPRDEISCMVDDVGDGTGEFLVKAVMTKNGAKVSELKLRVSVANKGGKKQDEG